MVTKCYEIASFIHSLLTGWLAIFNFVLFLLSFSSWFVPFLDEHFAVRVFVWLCTCWHQRAGVYVCIWNCCIQGKLIFLMYSIESTVSGFFIHVVCEFTCACVCLKYFDHSSKSLKINPRKACEGLQWTLGLDSKHCLTRHVWPGWMKALRCPSRKVYVCLTQFDLSDLVTSCLTEYDFYEICITTLGNWKSRLG